MGGSALFAGGGADEDLVCDVALRDGEVCQQGGSEGGGEAREDADAMGEAAMSKEGDFLASPAVDERIALFETDDRLSGRDGVEGGVEELRLRGVGVAGELAGYLEGGSTGDEAEDG